MRLTTLIGLALLATAPAFASTPDLRLDIASGRFVGTLGVQAPGESARFVSNGPDEGPDSGHAFGSVTKPVVAVAVLRLVQDGRLGLDDRLDAHLPSTRGKPAGAVTIRQLLSHSSGIPSVLQEGQGMDETLDVERWPEPTTMDEQVALFIDKPLLFPPGSRYVYSNSGYLLLGKLLEAKTGLPWDLAVSGLALAPAGLATRACFCDDLPGAPDPEATEIDASGTVRPAAVIHPTRASSAGALRMRPRDLLAWARALAQGEILSPALLAEAWTVQAPNAGGNAGMGLGWQVNQTPEGRVVWHDGSLPGAVSMLAIAPDTGRIAVGALDRTLPLAVMTRIEDYLRRRALGLALPARKPPVPDAAPAPAGLAGTYAFADGRRLVVTAEGEAWRVTTPDEGSSPLTLSRATRLDDEASAAAVALVRDWASGGQAAMLDRFGDGLRAALPEGALDAMWAELVGRLGEFRGAHAWGLREGGRISELRLAFERGALDLAVIRDPDGRVGGLRMIGEDRGDAPASLRAWTAAGDTLWIDGYLADRDPAVLHWIVADGAVAALALGTPDGPRATRVAP